MSVVARLDGGNEPLTYIPGTKTSPPRYAHQSSQPIFKPLIRYFYDRSHTSPPYTESPHDLYRLSNVAALSTRTVTTMPRPSSSSMSVADQKMQMAFSKRMDGLEARLRYEQEQSSSPQGYRGYNHDQRGQRPTSRDRHGERVDPYASHPARRSRIEVVTSSPEMDPSHVAAYQRAYAEEVERLRQLQYTVVDQGTEQTLPRDTVERHRRSVTINPEVAYRSPESYPSVASPPVAHVAPARQSRSARPTSQPTHRSMPSAQPVYGQAPSSRPAHGNGPYQEAGPLPIPQRQASTQEANRLPTPRGHAPHQETKPLPQPPTDPDNSFTDPESLHRPYWMETVSHTIFNLSLTFGHLLGSFASSILVFILGLVHCIITGVLLVIGTVIDGLTTMLRIFFNLLTCHFAAGDWGWEWTHLTRAWQWGRKSRWVWEFVGRVKAETSEDAGERVAKRRSLHEARKEEYKREQDEKGQASGLHRSASRAGAMANPYTRRSMDIDPERGNGRSSAAGQNNARGNY